METLPTNLDDIYSSLSKEERDVLDNIQNKLLKAMEIAKEQKFDHIDEESPENVPDFSQKHPEIIHPKHISKAPHEILITVKAEVSEINDQGYIASTKDMTHNYYHIPVPAQVDYEPYTEKFFALFTKSLQDICQDLNVIHKDSLNNK
jgi:hypothetical protein